MKCGLGEAPFYENNTKSLRFVDIVKEKLHIVDLVEGPSSLKSYDLGTPVRFASYICKDDNLLTDKPIVRLQILKVSRTR